MSGPIGAIEDAREGLKDVFGTMESRNPNRLDLSTENVPDNGLFAAADAENSPHSDHNTIQAVAEAIELANYGENPESYHINFIQRAGPAIKNARHKALLGS